KRSISKPISTFKIPEIHFPLLGQSVQSYYLDFTNHLSRAINVLSPENSALLARYFYLRGLVNLMQRKFLNALSDFQNLYKTDIRIFPMDLVRKMIENLPPLDRSQADQKPELKRLISHLLDKQREVTKTDDHVKKFELPKTHMQVNDFVKRIQESGIVKDTDTIHRLFDALTVGSAVPSTSPHQRSSDGRSMPMMVPKTTSETLKHKINPSAGETIPQAVEVLLYTPGQLEPTEKHGDAHPKLWCALNGGKVVVFDASTWSLQHSFKVGNSKLKCMIMAEQSQVWIGSADSVIYLINTHSMSCNKQLNDHRREIVDIVVDTRESLPSEVYSCSVDGTVIAWNISSLKVNRQFQLPLETVTSIQFYKNRLWCC
ncbi:DENN domain-containing protein 3, partial [Ophiophagus hannah]